MCISRFLLFSFLAICTGCSEILKKDRPDALSRQRINNSDKVLYSFTYYGAAYTGDYAGVTVLDSSEVFTRRTIELLPYGYFSAPPKGNELNLIHVDHHRTSASDTSRDPLRAYVMNSGGVQLNVVDYSVTYGSATFDTGLMRYDFDHFTEGPDSLTFHGVTKIFGGHELPSTFSIEKGNVWINDSADYIVLSIAINRVVNIRGRIYKPTSPFEIVPDQPIVGVVTYEFFPRGVIYSTELSDYGVWKNVRQIRE
jgi:hypothetical protein